MDKFFYYEKKMGKWCGAIDTIHPNNRLSRGTSILSEVKTLEENEKTMSLAQLKERYPPPAQPDRPEKPKNTGEDGGSEPLPSDPSPEPKPQPSGGSAHIDALAKEGADWLVDAVATCTQNRALLRGDDEEDKALTDCLFLNAEKMVKRVFEIHFQSIRKEMEATE